MRMARPSWASWHEGSAELGKGVDAEAGDQGRGRIVAEAGDGPRFGDESGGLADRTIESRCGGYRSPFRARRPGHDNRPNAIGARSEVVNCQDMRRWGRRRRNEGQRVAGRMVVERRRPVAGERTLGKGTLANSRRHPSRRGKPPRENHEPSPSSALWPSRDAPIDASRRGGTLGKTLATMEANSRRAWN